MLLEAEGGHTVLQYLCSTAPDTSQFTLMVGNWIGGGAGKRKVHTVLLQQRLPVVQEILADTSRYCAFVCFASDS